MKTKRPFTLLEIMIVIFLIGLIGGVVSYSMKGTLAEGKAFKTEQAIAKIQDLLELEIANGASIDAIKDHPLDFLQATGVIKDVKRLATDGWGKPLDIHVTDGGDVIITSNALTFFREKKGKLRHAGSEEVQHDIDR